MQKSGYVHTSSNSNQSIVLKKFNAEEPIKTNPKKISVEIPEHDDIPVSNLSTMEKRYYENLDQLVEKIILADEKRKSGFIMPVSNSRVSSKFGFRTHPIHGDRRFHSGVDYAAKVGTPIKAAKAGVVEFSGWKNGYGNTILIKHDSKYTSLYGHASKLIAKEGDTVQQGQVIALVGSTGKSTGPHLHFEIFENGKRINPQSKI